MAETTSPKANSIPIMPREVQKEIEMVDGVDKVVYARLYKDKDSQDGRRIYFQTDAKFQEKGKSDSVTTKDGATVNMKGIEAELQCDSYVTRNSDQYEWIYNAFHDHEKWELWIVDMKEVNEESKHKAMYCRAIMEERQDSMGAEDKEKMECKFKIEGKPKFGWTALNDTEDVTTDYDFVEIKRSV